MSSIQTPSFTRVRLREGYQIDEVDRFLLEIRPLVEGRLPNDALADRIESAVFSPVRLRPGTTCRRSTTTSSTCSPWHRRGTRASDVRQHARRDTGIR